MGRDKDLVVLITGCSSGIGRALAEEFSARGHRVFATARSQDSLADLESERVRTAELDVTDGDSIANAVAGRKCPEHGDSFSNKDSARSSGF